MRGELVNVGRNDFLIKIHGQLVEIDEIENTVIRWYPSKIYNGLVTKVPQKDDQLVAYVISHHLDLPIEKIREYCSKHLRQYMLSSYFVVLNKVPLIVNGKIDRKRLPLPSICCDANVERIINRKSSTLEEKVHNLWCSKLRFDTDRRHKNCFALGGSSLILREFFIYYQFHLIPDKQLNILDFLLIQRLISMFNF